MLDLSTFYGNLYAKDKPYFKVGFLVVSIMIVNFLGIKIGGAGGGSGPAAAFILLEIALIILDPLYAFVFAFVIHVDIIACLSFSYVPIISLFSMFYIFLVTKGLFQEILNNKKIKY